jgi:hypothetical protein
MQAGERRTAYRVPAGLEAAIRGFAEAMNMRVVAYASLGEQRAYCVLRAAHGTKSEETSTSPRSRAARCVSSRCRRSPTARTCGRTSSPS